MRASARGLVLLLLLLLLLHTGTCKRRSKKNRRKQLDDGRALDDVLRALDGSAADPEELLRGLIRDVSEATAFDVGTDDLWRPAATLLRSCACCRGLARQ